MSLIALYSILITPCLFSQVVYEPIHSGVYDFLDRMAQKGLIEFHDEIRPVSRQYIAEKLNELRMMNEGIINRHSTFDIHLSEVEREDLEFYLKDFGMELQAIQNSQPVQRTPSERLDSPLEKKFKIQNSKINDSPIHRFIDSTNNQESSTTLFNWDPYGRWRLFSYEDNLFKLNASPILGYEVGTRDGAKYSHRWNGISLYGYLSNNIGFNFRFWDNSEDGTTIDKTKSFTPKTGVIIAKADANNIQYSDINANITYNWKWGDISIGKDFLNWGYGQSGLLVLSDKAPSFPFIRLDIQPTKWLRFNYFHAWLASDIIDSTSSYATLIQGRDRTIYRSKYLASHTITVTPTNGLDISIGESIIYSDNLEFSYLFPLMFFRAAQQYVSQRNDGAGGNSQFFLGVSSRDQIKNTHLYGTLFIDEITLEGLFNPQTQRNQIGFTLGGSVTDLPIDNLTFTVEYTKIYPYVYSNYIQTQTYQSSGYVLGDWMGNNSDLIYGSLNYHFLRGLQATVWGQYIRKGAAETVQQDQIQPQPPFLFGLRTNYTYFGAEVKYEITNELFARLQYQTTNVSAQQTNLSFNDNRLNEFYIALYYGIM